VGGHPRRRRLVSAPTPDRPVGGSRRERRERSANRVRNAASRTGGREPRKEEDIFKGRADRSKTTDPRRQRRVVGGGNGSATRKSRWMWMTMWWMTKWWKNGNSGETFCLNSTSNID